MTPQEEYLEKARTYANGVRVLFAPPGAEGDERGGRGPVSAADLVGQAERLSGVSGDLTRAAVVKLDHPDLEMSATAAVQLLAKALTDLRVSAYLLDAARDEEDRVSWAPAGDRDRGVRKSDLDGYLKILTGELKPTGMEAERGGAAFADLRRARDGLETAIHDVLETISESAARASETALGDLVGLGAGALAEAAGLVGRDILTALGQAERVTRLYEAFRSFVARVYETLVALLGPRAQNALAQIQEWLIGLPRDALFGLLVEELYETQQTKRYLHQRLTDAETDLDRFAAAREAMDVLEGSFREQTRLAETFINGSKWLGKLATAVLPQADLILRSAYLVLGGYVLLVGADYADANRFRVLDRVPGVRRVVENKLTNS